MEFSAHVPLKFVVGFVLVVAIAIGGLSLYQADRIMSVVNVVEASVSHVDKEAHVIKGEEGLNHPEYGLQSLKGEIEALKLQTSGLNSGPESREIKDELRIVNAKLEILSRELQGLETSLQLISTELQIGASN